MTTYIISFLISFFLSLIFLKIFIPLLKKLKTGQPILKYVNEHKSKSGTVTFGGLLFIIPSVIVCLIIYGISQRITNVCIMIGISFLLLGFLDDFIKIKNKDNQGLKPYQKIFFQTLISVFAGLFAYYNNLTIFFIPFTKSSVNLGTFTIFLVAFIFIALTNSVNLTDGLDGLASLNTLIYLILLITLILLQKNQLYKLYYTSPNFGNMIGLSFCLCGGIIAFLLFNINPASIFMGDTGSLSLGGFLSAISVFSLNSLFVPIFGIMFVISSISVIIQVIYYKRTRKRFFIMAPFHHHLQHKGYQETKISFVYFVITLCFGLLSIISYL